MEKYCNQSYVCQSYTRFEADECLVISDCNYPCESKLFHVQEHQVYMIGFIHDHINH